MGGGVLVALALLTALAACSNSNDAASGGNGRHNAADVTFATNMIPHHAQAIEMADMAVSQARSPQVVRLAKAIKQAQQPEIETMTSWLGAWGKAVPAADSMAGMDHGMAGMNGMNGMEGMMSAADMKRLAATSGHGFDSMWLTMMIEHHNGAIAMARTEIADGTAAEATALARDIITAQQVEIDTMNRMLDKLAR